MITAREAPARPVIGFTYGDVFWIIFYGSTAPGDPLPVQRRMRTVYEISHHNRAPSPPRPRRFVRFRRVDPSAARMSVSESVIDPGFSGLIVAIAERGDRQAFAALFQQFAPRVKHYMMRLGATPEAAEELAQETLLIVWRRAAAFDPRRAAASTWIFTIARNLRIDSARREARVRPLDDPSEDAPPPSPPDAALLAAQDGARVKAALAHLPDDQVQVIRQAFFSDKPHSLIAAELGLPLGTVKSRLRLAMARLRAVLGEAS